MSSLVGSERVYTSTSMLLFGGQQLWLGFEGSERRRSPTGIAQVALCLVVRGNPAGSTPFPTKGPKPSRHSEGTSINPPLLILTPGFHSGCSVDWLVPGTLTL